MTETRLRSFFAGLPGMHGLAEAALSGRHGTVWPLADGAVLTAGDFVICGGCPGTEGARVLAEALTSQPREWLVYAPGPWEKPLRRLAPFRRVARQGFGPLAPDAPVGDLRGAERLPAGFAIRMMSRLDAEECLKAEWSRDFVREYGTAESFLRCGLGVLARDPAGRPAAGASAYVSWPGGIEVQLQTREDLQGWGLATAVAARLLRAARERRLTVAWDAANPVSAHIAEKLGFSPGPRYTAWEIVR